MPYLTLLSRLNLLFLANRLSDYSCAPVVTQIIQCLSSINFVHLRHNLVIFRILMKLRGCLISQGLFKALGNQTQASYSHCKCREGISKIVCADMCQCVLASSRRAFPKYVYILLLWRRGFFWIVISPPENPDTFLKYGRTSRVQTWWTKKKTFLKLQWLYLLWTKHQQSSENQNNQPRMSPVKYDIHNHLFNTLCILVFCVYLYIKRT